MLHGLNSLLPNLPHYGYVLVFIVVFLNNIGIPFPGEVVLLGAGFTSGNNGNGYWVKDPTGHIHQWGVVSGSGSISTNHVVTFPTAFTVSASIEVNATSSTIYGNGIGFLTIESGTVSTTQFEVEVGASAPVDGIHWSADGY